LKRGPGCSPPAHGNAGPAGFVLGLGLAQVISLPLFVVGVFLFIRAGRARNSPDGAAALHPQRSAGAGARGIAELALQLKLTRDQLHAHIRDLVGKGLFTGYINWKDGVLVAKTAGEMQTTKCPNCGGERQVVGKGVVQCPIAAAALHRVSPRAVTFPPTVRKL
jgi:hypothetical protein